MIGIQNKSKWNNSNTEKIRLHIKTGDPRNLKQLRSLMGCIHHLIKFTTNLATLSEPLGPLLSKSNLKPQNKLYWKQIHTDCSQK